MEPYQKKKKIIDKNGNEKEIVVKTKDGRSWIFRTYYTDMYGNRKQYESKAYFTKTEAKDAEREFLNSLSQAQLKSDITFKELITLFLEQKEEEVKITTYYVIKKKIKYLHSLHNIKLCDFTIDHFNFWKKEINKNEFTVTYKNNLYKQLRAILNFAIKYYDMNFLTSVMKKMTNFNDSNILKKEMQFFTYDEFKKFICHETELKYKVFFEILYYCGLRKGEANGLLWKDINFNNKTVTINKSVALKIKGHKYIILPPKTKTSERTLPLSERIITDLLKLKEDYSTYYSFNEDWFVFGGISPLGDTNIEKHKNKCCEQAEIKQIRIHDFRHSCASLLINNGASVTLVAKYLGHSNIATTLNTYSHMFKNQFDDIINMINNLENQEVNKR